MTEHLKYYAVRMWSIRSNVRKDTKIVIVEESWAVSYNPVLLLLYNSVVSHSYWYFAQRIKAWLHRNLHKKFVAALSIIDKNCEVQRDLSVRY